jgi:preprotein translocase subunit YajC
MLLVFAAFFFISQHRQQSKQQQERTKQLDEMKQGDEIITIGGLHGLLHEVDKAKGIITLDCEGIYLIFEHSAIRTIKSAKAKTVPPIETIDENSNK